jgi:hypothetical protein
MNNQWRIVEVTFLESECHLLSIALKQKVYRNNPHTVEDSQFKTEMCLQVRGHYLLQLL